MRIDYKNHYTDIARRGHYGYGLAGFHGVARYQRGHGLFGNFFKAIISNIVPALKFVGKHALPAVGSIASDLMTNKRSVKESAKDNLKQSALNMADEGLEMAKEYLHKGRGRKRKRKRKSIKGGSLSLLTSLANPRKFAKISKLLK